MKIAILGLGHVAIADALALGRMHQVRLTGPLPDRIEAINRGEYALSDPRLEGYLADHRPDLRALSDTAAVLEGAGMVLISMPLSVDPATGQIGTAEIESRILRAVAECPGVPVVIRSAVPFGFCARMLAQLPGAPLVYAPEFLREGAALSDLLDASYVIIGNRGPVGARVGRVLAGASLRADVHIRQIGLPEAEAVKHFSHALTAARLGYFNELDSYALSHGLDARQIITGVSLDPRVGDHANNPCFGHGGRAAAVSLSAVRQRMAGGGFSILAAIQPASEARVEFLVRQIAARNPRRVAMVQHGAQPSGVMALLGERLAEIGLALEALEEGEGALQDRTSAFDVIITQRLNAELCALGQARVFSRDHFARA